jgi:predicted transcriptional regulator of viral defense system
MRPLTFLRNWLEENASEEHYIFSFMDLRILFPSHSEAAYRTIISRATSNGVLLRVCQGIFIYYKVFRLINDGLILFRVASLLRPFNFNYISLETALSEANIISQIPPKWITLMTTGRSNIISCGDFGTIEFIHTFKKPNQLVDGIYYDQSCGLWRATIPQALNDMKHARRNMDLIRIENQ